MSIVTVGIDPAKNVFPVHVVAGARQADAGSPESASRAKVLELVAALRPCLLGMDARSGAHHWGPAVNAD